MKDAMPLDEFYFVLTLEGCNQRESEKILAGTIFNQQSFKFALPYEELLERMLTVQMIGAVKSGLSLSSTFF